STFSDILLKRQFTELNEKSCSYLNLDWSRYPQAEHITARLLSGAILTNIGTKQDTMLNEAEAYGRDGMLDCHKEQTGEVKGVPRQTSVPSTTAEEYYPRVPSVTIHSRDWTKLVNGSKPRGILVTSCIRHDKVFDGSVSVGNETCVFGIPTSQIKDIRIFVDKE
ncbi:MAG: hypothetical protein J3Q66DRAFT_282881, partial [Benniella sp.]